MGTMARGADDEGTEQQLWAPEAGSLPSVGRLTKAEFQARAGEAREGECLVVIAGRIFDLAAWNDEHPGGDFLLEHHGEDLTTEFELVRHSERARAHMRHFCVGEIVADTVASRL